MTVDQKEIGGYHGSNSPFISMLHLIDRRDVVEVLDPIRYNLPGTEYPNLPVGGLRLKTGADLTKMKFPPQSCTMEMKTVRTAAGVSYDFIFEFPMPASRQDVDRWVRRNREQQFLVLAETPSGLVRLVGNEERGLRASCLQTVGVINQYFLTISGSLNMPAFIVNPVGVGSDLKVIFADTDFNTDFSLDFNS